MALSPLADPAYAALLESLKERVQQARIRTALSANRELVLLYWNIGREVLARQAELGWGAKVVDRLSRDLRSAFPEMKGFSARNLKYMRALAESWPDQDFVQQAVAQIPWGHLVRVLDKVSPGEHRQFYIERCAVEGWSRARLVQQIERGLHERQGAAVTKFARTLPTTRSDLATQVLKDP